MKLARKAMGDPDRGLELEEHMDIDITELLAKAADAGHTEEEAITAILNVAKYQSFIYRWQPAPGDDQCGTKTVVAHFRRKLAVT